jgi:hypothetical protein
MQETQRQSLEIRLERLDQHSWVAALNTGGSGAFGTAAYRFAARAESEEGDAKALFSAAFPLQRVQRLDESGVGDAWSDVARMRLHELDHALQQAGWKPEPTRGRHWWSLRYTRR